MRWPGAAVLLLALVGCGKPKAARPTGLEDSAAGASDSVVARSKLPGAGGVRRALEAADSARARRAAEDTIQ